MRTIFVCLNTGGVAEREFLSGIMTYSKMRTDWNIRLESHPERLSAGYYADIAQEASGAIVCETGVPDLDNIIRRSRIPIVVFGSPRSGIRRGNLTFVTSDDLQIGISGARHLLSLGNFRQFAFVPDPDAAEWSRNRQRGFLSEISRAGRSAAVFNWADASTDLSALSAWIRTFPLPIALMAAEDPIALDIFSTCRSAGLRIPEQVSVLGVNDDSLICGLVNPPLSSVAANHEKEGWLAAKSLASMMRRRRDGNPRTICCKNYKVIERGSSAPVAPASHIILMARSYIDENARRDITVSEVARHLGISRRLLDLRFRQFTGSTVNRAIVIRRLEEVKRLLLLSELPVHKIAHSCGFANLSYLATLFKREIGRTMGQFREENRS